LGSRRDREDLDENIEVVLQAMLLKEELQILHPCHLLVDAQDDLISRLSPGQARSRRALNNHLAVGSDVEGRPSRCILLLGCVNTRGCPVAILQVLLLNNDRSFVECRLNFDP